MCWFLAMSLIMHLVAASLSSRVTTKLMEILVGITEPTELGTNNGLVLLGTQMGCQHWWIAQCTRGYDAELLQTFEAL